MLTRRKFFAVASSAVFSAWDSDDNLTARYGAIRWDGQYCNDSNEPCGKERLYLGDTRWRHRAPLHSQLQLDGSLRFKPTQESFDAEILAASAGGLDYWAYLTYGDPLTGIWNLGNSMMKAFAFHRSSQISNSMKYCFISVTNTLGRSGEFSKAVDSYVDRFSDINYLRCLNNRPVLYLLFNRRHLLSYWGNSTSEFKKAIDILRVRTIKAGCGNPYIILLQAPPLSAASIGFDIGADAISVYAGPTPRVRNTSYAVFSAGIRQYWEQEVLAFPAGVVPTIMIGWDPRPRSSTSLNGDHGLAPTSGDSLPLVVPPTPEEFSAECSHAIDFIRQYPRSCDSRLVIIYAWNENSEGGQLEPTLGDPGGEYLKVLRRFRR